MLATANLLVQAGAASATAHFVRDGDARSGLPVHHQMLRRHIAKTLCQRARVVIDPDTSEAWKQETRLPSYALQGRRTSRSEPGPTEINQTSPRRTSKIR